MKCCSLIRLNCFPQPSPFAAFSPLKKNPKPLPGEAVQGDQPDEQKQNPRKDRKGKKNKNKRDKDSEGKGKRKGKGKGRKGSRRRKHEENQLEDGLLGVSTAPPPSPSYRPFQSTQLPEIQKGLETVISAEDFEGFPTEAPSQELQSGTEAPPEEPEESKVAEEVDEFPRRPSPACVPPPSLTSSLLKPA